MSEPSNMPTTPMREPGRLAESTAVPALGSQRAALALGAARQSLVRSVTLLHYQLTRIGPAGLAGAAAMLIAAVLALAVVLPQHSALDSLQAQLLRAKANLANPGAPMSGARLVATLPTRGQIPAVLGQMLEQADQAGVALDQGHYTYLPARPGSLGRYTFEFPVKGAYPNVRNFIDRALVAVPAAGLSKLRIERKSVGDPQIAADIGFVVYVRGE
ncbi:MAG TPA: hypothetical protein VF848_07205 [Steroidobacteraceae bacterium]